MPEQVFFSVIIPTLNEEKFLPRLLADLSKQSCHEFEVIVVDGDSEDRTREMAQPYSNVFDLQIINNGKRNVASQRNFGAQKAKGKYIIFLDADTQLSSRFLQQLKKYIDEKHGLVFIPAIEPGDMKSDEMKVAYRFVNLVVAMSQNLDRPFSTGGSQIWERNFFHLVGGFDESIFMSEDHAIIQKAHRWGVKARFLNNIKLKFSLRRIKKEGTLQSSYKLLVGTIYTLFRGNIKDKIFEYEMGGQLYNSLKKNEPKSIINSIKKIYDSLADEQ